MHDNPVHLANRAAQTADRDLRAGVIDRFGFFIDGAATAYLVRQVFDLPADTAEISLKRYSVPQS